MPTNLAPALSLDFAKTKQLDPRITFTRASKATYFGADGILRTATNGESRFDHDPVTGECKGLLIEGARTNLLTYSEQFDNAAWTKARSSISANAIAAPDGTLTADKLVEDSTTSNTHSLQGAQYTATSTTLTASIYAKASERTKFLFEISNFLDGSAYCLFDLVNGTAGPAVSATADYTFPSASIVAVGGGWYRCSLTATKGTANNINRFTFNVHNDTTHVYTGNGVSGIYAWGAQLEAGAFPTSYIPTVGSAASRSADVANMSGVNFSNWYNQTEGSFVADFSPKNTTSTTIIAVSNGSGAETVQLRYASGSSLQFAITDNSINQVNVAPNGYSTVGANYNVAVAYKANDCAQAINGIYIASDATSTMPTVNQLGIGNIYGNEFFSGHISRIAYFNSRLPNNELKELSKVASDGVVSPSLQLNFSKTKQLDPRITFVRGSKATYVGADGLIKLALDNQPRFDHDPITGECKGLLIEEARTNLLLNSDTLVTQSITTTASARTLSFYGTGTVVLSGTHSAAVVGLGAYPTRTIYTYTPTAGTLTLTVTGSVLNANDELGAFATSWIPTTIAATRSADLASMTGVNFSSWYNQSEGTIATVYSRFSNNTAPYPVNIANTLTGQSASSRITVRTDGTRSSQVQVVDNNVTQVNTTNLFSNPEINARCAVAFGYKANDFAASGNGATPVVDTDGTVPTGLISMVIGGVGTLNGHISKLTYFNRRLSNSELQALSSQ